MKNNEYQVDIIVPVYNVEKYISQCIDSLINQTYSNIGIILVDDGSTDSSGKICDSYSEKYENIRVIHKLNGGLVSAWTKGLEYSSAHWVNFVDADDWIQKNHIKELVYEQIRTGADIVVTRMLQVDVKGTRFIQFEVPAGCYKDRKLYEELYPVMINTGKFERRGIPFSRCSKLIRKEIMIENLKYLYKSATFEEDFNIMAPTLMDAKCIALIEVQNAAYCYRRVENSMLHGYSPKMLDSIKNIYPLLFKACIEKNCTCLLKQIKTEYVSACIRLYTNELKSSSDYNNIKKKIREVISEMKFNDYYLEANNIKYPLKIKLVVYAIKNVDTVWEHILTRILYEYQRKIR